ncbi:MAG TPA: alpha/beta hydrolase [Spirochaetota bacterium]|nr:alpha/beta hydrolase [Spirochaetota bacterium]HOD15406.1 alpha/beta hydrolase [Spirochaetota bacterium]HPG50655.1 alpha/beta hydrolase [Spirochaetota bacterium]HPN11448.1 alpha/beta hydrolase [Spirochaetota bacterium]HQL80722.1 alpha/beta hydrolase [Spirochaetota bacterium]
MIRNFFIKLIIRSRRSTVDYTRPIAIRKGAEKIVARYMRLPDRCEITPVNAGGIQAEWVSWQGSDNKRVIFYLHGGGYSICSPRTHRDLMCRLARTCGARVLVPDYRLAPENPHPAAVEDAVKSYRWLLKSGVKPSRVAVMGDSAGGGLALVLLQQLRDKKIPLPACAVCLSPWSDLTGSGDSMRKNRWRDPLFTREAIVYTALLYAPYCDLAKPAVSPLFGSFKGLPPLLIQVGSGELLLDDSRRVAEKAAAEGVKTDITVWPGMIHVFQALAFTLKEARNAIRDIGLFVGQYIP